MMVQARLDREAKASGAAAVAATPSDPSITCPSGTIVEPPKAAVSMTVSGTADEVSGARAQPQRPQKSLPTPAVKGGDLQKGLVERQTKRRKE